MPYLYVGSFGPQHGCRGAGVVTLALDPITGRVSEPLQSVLTDSPGYLAASASRKTIYAAHLLDQGKVTVMRRLPDGRLDPVGVVSTGGSGPCHILARHDRLVVSNFHSGSVAVIPLGADESIAGSPMVFDLNRPDQEAHPHGAWTIPSENGTVVVTDLGLDTLTTYRTAGGGLSQPCVSGTMTGSGPRHLAIAPSGDVFVTEERSSTVSRYRYDQAKQRFEVTARLPSTLIAGVNYPSDIALSAAGRRIYVLNRGNNTVSVFDTSSGALQMLAEVASGGLWPQHCALVFGWLLVANQDSDRVVAHRLHPQTGIPVREDYHVAVASPTCLLPILS